MRIRHTEIGTKEDYFLQDSLEKKIWSRGLDGPNEEFLNDREPEGYEIQQNPSELAKLISLLNAYGPFDESLDIGVAQGGTTRFIREMVEIGRTTIIDDGKHPRHHVWLEQNRKDFPGELIEIYGDSHSQQVAEYLRKLDFKFDLVCIDGDHSYRGVKRDWELVQPYLAENALIWFHDIKFHPPVKKFWEEMDKNGHEVEFSETCGIGVCQYVG